MYLLFASETDVPTKWRNVTIHLRPCPTAAVSLCRVPLVKRMSVADRHTFLWQECVSVYRTGVGGSQQMARRLRQARDERGSKAPRGCLLRGKQDTSLCICEERVTRVETPKRAFLAATPAHAGVQAAVTTSRTERLQMSWRHGRVKGCPPPGGEAMASRRGINNTDNHTRMRL